MDSLAGGSAGGRGAPARRPPAKAPCRISMPKCNGHLTGNHGETRKERENAKEVGSCGHWGQIKNHARQRTRHLVADHFERSEPK